MSNTTCMKRMKKNEAGFTMIELIIASFMSLLILGLVAHVFRSQQKEFGQQTEIGSVQSNGRAATQFIARSVQNAGFNVQRGTRFLAASDHYLTAVYDENNDNVIQNNEVITYSLANPWNAGSIGDDHPFTARFDVDSDGVVDSTEAPVVPFQMTTTGPPFNLYKVTPDAAGTSVVRSLIARNIDNMVIKYYDRNDELLPKMIDTDIPPDGIGDVALVDANSDGVPDNGNWTYTFPLDELNDIRKVKIEVLARSRKVSPREATSSGNYAQGSLAAVTSGSTAYSDQFIREDFTANMAPRNLILAPWGSMSVSVSPALVACPTTDSTITATVLDRNGDSVSGSTITFTATGSPTVTLASSTDVSDSSGEGSTTVSYDFTDPYFTSTISANANVDDGTGTMRPVFSAAPVSFSFNPTGSFVDAFDGLQTMAWTDMVPGSGFVIAGAAGSEHFKSSLASPGIGGTVNGCNDWKDYSVQTNIVHTGSVFNHDDYYTIMLRYTDANNYYYARVRRFDIGAPNQFNILEFRKVVLGLDSFIQSIDLAPTLAGHTPGTVYDFAGTYVFKAQMKGTTLQAKVWRPADPLDPNADEPAAWALTRTETELTNGRFGLMARGDIIEFDDVKVDNAL